MAVDRKTHRVCAIYTRKSSEEGLEQEFNSLDAQREACEAFVLSQRHEGWRVFDQRYDDGGFSGGNIERPGLNRLLDEVRHRRIDVVVVYKVDRLTRSLSDFAKIVDVFDAHGVSFVSVTQQFNTTTSMGRLTLNVLLSFAQFEREVTGERIRDKIAASRKKGMWMGGPVPLGYDLRDHKLIVNKIEAETVGLIFRLYAEYRCVRRLKATLDHRRTVSKHRTNGSGRSSGGKPFSRGQLYYLLKNRLYLGAVVHKEQVYPGQHAAIIDSDLWNRVQTTLVENRSQRANGLRHSDPSLLAGIVFDDRGNRLTPSHSRRRGRRYRYYVCHALLQDRPDKSGPLKRLPAQEIEDVVQGQLLKFLSKPAKLIDELVGDHTEPSLTHALLSTAKDIVAGWHQLDRSAQMVFVRTVVKKVVASNDGIAITLSREALTAKLIGLNPPSGDDQPVGRHQQLPIGKEAKPILLEVPVRLKRCGYETRVLIGPDGGEDRQGRINRALVKTIVHAFDWREQVYAGKSAQDIADDLDLDRSYVAHVIPLAFLAPDIVDAVLDGRQPPALKVKQLFQSLPTNWAEQRRVLGFPAR